MDHSGLASPLTVGREQTCWYAMYGLRVRSDLRLPFPALAAVGGEAGTPDLTIRCPDPGQEPSPAGEIIAEVRCHCPEHRGAVITRVQQGPEGSWLWHRSVATFVVAADARSVDVYPEPGGDAAAVKVVLAGQVALFILFQRGIPSLHAGAVVTDEGAVAFMGPHGQGKSTMVACFLRRDATLLTDDALPLQAMPDGVYGVPALPMMKVWRTTAEAALALSEDLPGLAANTEKRLFVTHDRYPFAQRPAPIRALYVLDRYDPEAEGQTAVSIRELPKPAGLATLASHTSPCLYVQPGQIAKLLPLYARLVMQAPVRILRYPAGFQHQDAVHARVLADLRRAR